MREKAKENSGVEATNDSNNNSLVNVVKKRRKKHVSSLPYIEHFSENISKVFLDTNFHCVFSNNNKIDFLFADKKDKIEKLERINSVYLIPCKNCPKVYIGQTKHKLRVRLAQHMSSTYKNNKNCTALVKHCRETKHVFDFDKICILNTESKRFQRNILEMLYITKNLYRCVNYRRDVERLSKVYNCVV